jgi:hypothetical protein
MHLRIIANTITLLCGWSSLGGSYNNLQIKTWLLLLYAPFSGDVLTHYAPNITRPVRPNRILYIIPWIEEQESENFVTKRAIICIRSRVSVSSGEENYDNGMGETYSKINLVRRSWRYKTGVVLRIILKTDLKEDGLKLIHFSEDKWQWRTVWTRNWSLASIKSARLLECVISDFLREVDDNCTLMGYYAASRGNFLPTFRDNLSVPSSGAALRAQRSAVLNSLITWAVFRFSGTQREWRLEKVVSRVPQFLTLMK